MAIKIEVSEAELKSLLQTRIREGSQLRYNLSNEISVKALGGNIRKLEESLAITREVLKLLRSHIARKANTTRRERKGR